MKKTMKIALSGLCALSLAFSAAACSLPSAGGGSSSDNSSSEGLEEKKAATFVSLDVNPTLEMTVDEKGAVVSVYGTNDDGQILLYDGDSIVDGIVGTDVENAVEKITDLAVELGYLTEENKVVSTAVSGANAESLQTKINAKITAAASELGLNVTTDMEGAFSLLRKMKAFKAQYPQNTAIQSLTVEDFRLALSASEAGGITLETAVTLDDSELVNMIAQAHSELDYFTTEAFDEAKKQASATYDKAVGMATAMVYMEKTATNLLAAPYGAAYAMYAASACGFEAVADGMDAVEKIGAYSLNDEQITAILNALGMENTPQNKALIADEDGNVTVDSVEEYVDVLFKNSEASAELEEMKEALALALSTAESKLIEEIEMVKAKYKPEIEAIIQAGATGATALKTVQALLPEVLKTAAADYETLSEDVIAAITDGTLTSLQLREYANTLWEKADVVLTELKGKLSADDLATIEQRKQQIIEGYADEKAAMEQAIANAETQAREYLRQEREKRLAK